MSTEAAAIKTDTTGTLQSQGSLVTLVLLGVVASIWFPELFAPAALANTFRQASMKGLLAIGMSFVILSGGIDLSVGSTAAVASVLAAHFSGQFVLIPIVVSIGAGVAIGAVNGEMIARWKIPPFIATLAMMLGARGLAFIISGGKPVPARNMSGWFSQMAKGDILGIPYCGILFVLALVAAVIVARYTSFGRRVYAIGGNEEAARMMGLNVDGSKRLVYMICGGFAGAGGMLLTSRVSVGQPIAAVGWELTAIAAVVIGGISLTGGVGKIGHTLYGVMILAIIPKLINSLGFDRPYYDDLITGVMLLAVVLLQSRIAR